MIGFPAVTGFVGYLAAVGSSRAGVAAVAIILGLIFVASVTYIMYWSVHCHHSDYDDNDWDG